MALDGSGNVQASVLYGPNGAVRYSSGTMPGSYGYTGQHADATTGLDYYNARYYDASVGQFASADTAQDGLNRYGYVQGNPTTFTDPSGHWVTCGVGCNDGGGTTGDCVRRHCDDGGSGSGQPPKCGDPGVHCVGPAPTPTPVPKPQPAPVPSCGESGQPRCPGAPQPPKQTSGGEPKQGQGAGKCGDSPCEVGNTEYGNWLALIGYFNDVLLGIGKDGILGLINRVQGMLDRIFGAALVLQPQLQPPMAEMLRSVVGRGGVLCCGLPR